MSSVSQGPGWWQASDGKWYSPEQSTSYDFDDGEGPVAAHRHPNGGGGWRIRQRWLNQLS